MVSYAELNAMLPGWQLVGFFFVMIIFLFSGGIVTFVMLSKKRWPIKVMILNKRLKSLGSFISGWDRARRVGLLRTGEEIYLWKKRKKYRVGNEEFVGTNTMAWARGKDGYYRNVGLGDVDKELKSMGVTPTNLEMRTMTGLVDQAIQDRHDGKNFMEKYMVPIVVGMLIMSIIASGGMQLWQIHENNKSKPTELETAKTNLEVAKTNKEVLNGIANLKSGGSGLVPA